MGSETRVVEKTETQTTPQATEEERQLNKLQLEREKFLDPQIRDTQSRGLALVEQLLAGNRQLPGFFQDLEGGISGDVTKGIVNESLNDLNSQLAQSGVGTFRESGAAQEIGTRTAGDIRRASEEFNIGNRLNLLNLALSGQAQVQQPVLGFSQALGGRLAGLRSVNQTGTSTSVQNNPFITGGQILQGVGTGIGAYGAFKGFGGS